MSHRPVNFSTLKALSFFTQAGFSFCIPLVLCIWGASALRSRFGLGNGILIAGILVGLYAGISGFVGVIRSMERMARQAKQEEMDDG